MNEHADIYYLMVELKFRNKKNKKNSGKNKNDEKRQTSRALSVVLHEIQISHVVCV